MPQEADLSVLLIEDEHDAAVLIQHVLSQASRRPLAVSWASDLNTGLQRMEDRDFQAILLDLNLPDSTGFDTFARVRQRAGGRAVVVLTGQEDEGLALRALRAGADDYLIKSEVRVRFLAQRVRYAVERNRLKRQAAHSAAPQGKVYSFVGVKGGAGTTTLVLNVAAELAKTGNAVVAVELTPGYGSFAALLDRPPASDLATLWRLSADGISPDVLASCLEPVHGGFRALCGPQRAEESGALTREQTAALLVSAGSLADYTVVDVSATVGSAIEDVVRHSAMTTLVLEPNRLGLRGALQRMADLQTAAAQPASLAAVLINRAPFVEFLSAAEISRQLHCPVLATVPPAADLLDMGEHSALPVLDHPDTDFSSAIGELARHLVPKQPGS
jgi:DNA-binding response OmpR family regulator